jgi:hypothetical protein
VAPDPEQSVSGEKKHTRSKLDLWRRSGAGVVLLLLTGAVIWSNATSHLWVCVDTITTISTRPVVHLCHPLGVTDAPVVLVLVVVAALMFQDISTIKIGGLIELERSVKESVKEQEKLTENVERILNQVSTNAQAIVNNYYWQPGEFFPPNPDQFARKTREFKEALAEPDESKSKSGEDE